MPVFADMIMRVGINVIPAKVGIQNSGPYTGHF
jgi:hypothetical protein